jgi:hypothetical protein
VPYASVDVVVAVVVADDVALLVALSRVTGGTGCGFGSGTYGGGASTTGASASTSIGER